MKRLKSLIVIGLIFIISLTCYGSDKSTNIVELKELLRIEDNGVDFYFKYPDTPVIDKM